MTINGCKGKEILCQNVTETILIQRKDRKIGKNRTSPSFFDHPSAD